LKEHSFGNMAYTPIERDYHAFTSLDINANETRIAIPATVYENNTWDYTGLLLFTLDKNSETLSFDGTLKASMTDSWSGASSWSDRAVIQHSEAGDVVHYIHLGEVISTRWETVE